ncbi:ABC transporter ATP-binding protein [Gilvimarinus polysaccharolyticus]|uniref:ABC transporter ATP-binding protein n=1 Tax=Gilvimarinus polysaccharolyticus TaxID=863921 RepID=UPI0006736358|nr:ABC transporter ATP-binding protein [Gilvimarinus polysaccharolyticus]
MSDILTLEGVDKTYDTGFNALSNINLSIRRGEIFALLGPNGAGKTTLIGIICGIVNATAGRIVVDSHDTQNDFRQARKQIGLVPQELSINIFDSVWNTVHFSRGLFGCPPDDAYLEQLLKNLSLWEKKDSRIMALSGGMKRRVLIAKALAHQPTILFLDEPTAGVDVELRREMWAMIRRLRGEGVTIILTTHYIEEAEDMADRIGVINKGKLMLVEDKHALMRELGRKSLTVLLSKPITQLPTELMRDDLQLADDGASLIYHYSTAETDSGVSELLAQLQSAGIHYQDLQTRQSSLEEIFVSLVEEKA